MMDEFKKRINILYNKQFPPTFKRQNLWNGEEEICMSGVSNTSNVGALFCNDLLRILSEAKKELVVPSPKRIEYNSLKEHYFALVRWSENREELLEKWFGE